MVSLRKCSLPLDVLYYNKDWRLCLNTVCIFSSEAVLYIGVCVQDVEGLSTCLPSMFFIDTLAVFIKSDFLRALLVQSYLDNALHQDKLF